MAWECHKLFSEFVRASIACAYEFLEVVGESHAPTMNPTVSQRRVGRGSGSVPIGRDVVELKLGVRVEEPVDAKRAVCRLPPLKPLSLRSR